MMVRVRYSNFGYGMVVGMYFSNQNSISGKEYRPRNFGAKCFNSCYSEQDQISSFFDYKTIKLFCNTGWQTRCNVL
jgi:hypothetical protein